MIVCAGSKSVDTMVGLVAQSGRAPGFYSSRVTSMEDMSGTSAGLMNEKRPDGRGFKSLRARQWEVIA